MTGLVNLGIEACYWRRGGVEESAIEVVKVVLLEGQDGELVVAKEPLDGELAAEGGRGWGLARGGWRRSGGGGGSAEAEGRGRFEGRAGEGAPGLGVGGMRSAGGEGEEGGRGRDARRGAEETRRSIHRTCRRGCGGVGSRRCGG